MRDWQEIRTGEKDADTLVSLVNFAKAVFYTAKNHRDNMQSDLPSYRERIVTIRLGCKEGGMNLDMSPDVIKKIQELGKRAGAKLRDFEFEHHRWVRFRVIMAHLEHELDQMIGIFEEAPPPHANAKGETENRSNAFRRMVREGNRAPYPWCFTEQTYDGAKVLENILALRQAIRELAGNRPIFFNREVPLPEMLKRLVPKE